MSPSSFRPVNQNLGARPQLGPVPAELVLPWGVIGIGTLLLSQLLTLNWVWTLVFILSDITIWWVLTGKTPWRFLAKFHKVPHWAKGYITFTPVTPQSIAHARRRRR